jgi:hypothetical protein
MALDIVAVGNVNIDLIFAPTPSMPRWGEELLVPDFEMRLAGSAGYFAIASAKLGMECGLVASVGDDVYGDFMLRELRREGIKARVSVERKMPSGVCASIVRDDGERAFVSYVGNLSRWSLADIRRSFRLTPNGATVGFDNLMTGTSVIRGVKPEATLTIGGRTYAIGGLVGQPEYAYLLPQWIDTLKSDPASFHCTGYEIGKPAAPFAWQRKRHAADLPWPPPGVALDMHYQPPDGEGSAAAGQHGSGGPCGKGLRAHR